MHLPLFAVLSFLTTYASCTALTYKLAHGETFCAFTHIANPSTKIAFYFAVQSGGSFDVDYTVTDPRGQIVLNGEHERQGDFVFTANDAGEYKFCFDNKMSSVSDKMVDFEIAVENESKTSLPSRQGAPAEQTSLLSESIFKISGQLSTVTRHQKYFRTRENRNFSTVRSTEQRIWRFSVIEVMAMVGMAGLQVFIVRFFFTGARKGFV